MSLNGLDSPELQDAYQTAIAEAGGWFLLKYTSRDAIELLARGKHGVSEARNAILAYHEPSPLYGLLMYRRRKTLIKYVPEATSRLLQARTTVHFQDVLERYSPYETLLEITTSDALNDTSLAASFHLHTASPLPSVTRLDEIKEDEDDSGAGTEHAAGTHTPAASLRGAPRMKSDRMLSKRADRSLSSLYTGTSALAMARRSTPPASPSKVPVADLHAPPDSHSPPPTPVDSQATSVPAEGRTIAEQPSPVTASAKTAACASEEPVNNLEHPLDATKDSFEVATDVKSKASEAMNLAAEPSEQNASDAAESRKSMSERRSSARAQSTDEDPYDFSKYDALFKPKVKLGPRPVNSPDKVKNLAVARVSAVPASLSLRPVSKKQELVRPKSQGQSSSTRAEPALLSPERHAITPLPPIPDASDYKSHPISRGSVKSAPSQRSLRMTPDKIRLMKAVELRKKQLRKSQEPIFKPIDEEVPEMPMGPPPLPPQERGVGERSQSEPLVKFHPNLTEDAPRERGQDAEHTIPDDESQHQSIKADSGIELRSGTPDTHQNDDTGDESHASTALERPGTAGYDAAAPIGNDSLGIEPDAIPSNTGEEEFLDGQADTLSTTASQTPTERPMVSDGGSDVTTAAPQIVIVSTPDDAQALLTSDPGETDDAQSVVDEVLADAADPTITDESDLVVRRRGFVEPLRLSVNSGNPDDFLSDDDDFLEELQSTTLQDAKPVTVSMAPGFSGVPGRRPSADTLSSVRSVQISRITTSSAAPSLGRFDHLSPVSAKMLLSASVPSSPMEEHNSNRQRNVSSGISKRIQALADLSNREASSSGNTLSSRSPSPSGLSPQEARDHRPALRASSNTRPSSYRKQSRSANHSPLASPNDNKPTWTVQHDPITNRNSISVSARIKRPATNDASGGPENSFQKSDLSVNKPLETELSRSASFQSTKSSGSHSLQSLNSRFGKIVSASPGVDDFPPPPSNARVMPNILPPVKNENAAPKESSRTTRFFKRMSTLAGPKRKLGIQPAPSVISLAGSDANSTTSSSGHTERASVAIERSDIPPPVVVGDFNVQFPDSLLWKRRIVTIDDSGHLQFAIAQAMDIYKGVAMKRYPLVGFKAPYVPDLDRQELSHSMVLEFMNGAALQIACEDAMTQRQVFSVLKTYWKAYTERPT